MSSWHAVQQCGRPKMQVWGQHSSGVRNALLWSSIYTFGDSTWLAIPTLIHFYCFFFVFFFIYRAVYKFIIVLEYICTWLYANIVTAVVIISSAVGRFDPQWLKPAYQDAENVKNLRGLTETERKYLAGLHRRQRNTVLPKVPSESDFRQLHMTYSKSSTISMSFGPIFAVVK